MDWIVEEAYEDLLKKHPDINNIITVNIKKVKKKKSLYLLYTELKNLAPHVNICEKLSIEGLISLIPQVDLIIGPDTGPTHIGWALNVPSITLFGPTPGYRNTLVTANNKIIESESDVNPYRIDKNDYSISTINAIQVVEIAKSLL